MVNIPDLFDDAKCDQAIRDMRWPDGVTFPRCSSDIEPTIFARRTPGVGFATR